MRNLFFILFLFASCIISCSKDGSSADTGSNSIGTGGSLARFIIVGNYLYMADVYQIKVFDISRNGFPVEKNPVSIDAQLETIFSYNNNLFIGSAGGMYIYSLSNPASPSFTGMAQHFRSCDPVVANDSFAYVTLQGGTACGPVTDGLYIYNIQAITNPVLIDTLQMSTPAGLALNGNIIYVCRKTNGLSVVNVADATKPVLEKTLDDADFEDVIVYDNLLICYVSTGIRLYDISVPGNPVYISTVTN